jgi:hypothetical protein
VGRNTETYWEREKAINRSWSKAGVAAGWSYPPWTNLLVWVFCFHHFPLNFDVDIDISGATHLLKSNLRMWVFRFF